MKKILISLLLIAAFIGVRADHNAGGKVSWKCLKSNPNKGRYVFTVHLYRFCTGIPLSGFANLQSNSPAGNISLTRISQSDISPSCYLGQQIDCNGGPPAEDYAIEEHVYQSAPVILNGVPPASGWSFQWNSCCRPAPAIYSKGFLVDNLEPQNQSYRIQAIMYPYQNRNANPCYDSSPTFAETPATIICTNYEFTYNHNAEDEENDSLHFAWTTPLLSNGSPVSYATHLNTNQTTPRPNGGNFIVPSPGFSPTVPMPWSHPNMSVNNQPATLNPITGEISFLSYTPGSFATAVVCDAFKCGVKVASIYIDIPVFLISCAPLPPPFPPGTYNTPPTVSLTYKTIPTTNLNISVLAGEYVEFEVRSTDPEFLPGFVQQSNIMRPSSSQFGTNYSDTLLGCPYPPCATMDTASTPPVGYYVAANNEWKGVSGVRSNFKWRTDCNHLAKQINSCFVRSNVYTFVFKILDDYCPAPGANFVTASVTVNAPDPIPAPELKCVSIAANGDVSLSWNLPIDPSLDTNNSFRKYILFRTTKRDTANYTPIDTFLNPLTLTYTDLGANAHVSPKHYFIMGVSSCNDQSQLVPGDTISTMTLTATAVAGGDSVELNWTSFVKNNVFPSTTTGTYNIYEVYQGDTTLIQTQTSNKYENAVTTCLGGSKCFPSNITYFVTVEDTTQTYGCISYSNSKTLALGDNKPPVAPNILSASVEAGPAGTQLSWDPSLDCDVEKYYILENGVVIDSVGANSVSYFRPFVSGTNIGHPPIEYTISAIDSCGNLGNVGLAHKTMMDSINGNGIIRCAPSRLIPIVVTPYEGNVVSKYILYADTGGGYYPIDSIDPTLVTFPYTFNFTKFSTDSNFYTFQLRALDTNNIAFSKSSVDTIFMYTVDGTIIDPPVISCIQYLPNGNIRIQWQKPPNTSGNFDSYRIYHSTDGTNFLEIDSILSSTRSGNGAWDSTSYTHTNINPNQDHYYRVYSQSGCFGKSLSAPSNTIKALRLDIAKIQANVNQLSWDYTITPNTLGNYQVYREYPIPSSLQVFSALPQSKTDFNDTLNICEDSARYQVRIEDRGCFSISNTVLGEYKDNIPPPKQFLDSASVFSDTNVIIGWSDNPSPDVTQYIVIKKQGLGYEILDTISGNARFYNIFNQKGCFAVVPVDSCNNDRLSEGNFDFHCSMSVSIDIDRCDESFTINWNPYETFFSGSNVLYEVFAAENGTKFASIGTTDKSFFRFSEPVSGNDYCFFVRAIEQGGAGKFTSSSDSVCARAKFLVKPEYAYMQHVTVRDSGKIELSVWVDLNADIEEYNILRGLEENKLKQVATIVAPNVLTPADLEFKYIDESPATNLKSYYYKVAIIDPCGDEVFRSNKGKSILLQVEADNQSKSNKLSWSAYEGWESGVLNYKVYRKLEGNTARFIETVKGNVVEYKDDVSDLVEESQGLFCYYVEANEATPLFPGLDSPDTSRSNEVCVIQYPLFYIPTSFTPGSGNSPGLNDVFKPVGVFIDYDSYSFEIYNRWGEKLFYTKDFEKGWDGTIDGKIAPLDSYVYIITYKGADGRQFEQKGSVNLLK